MMDPCPTDDLTLYPEDSLLNFPFNIVKFEPLLV